ncbi:MAG TPA: MarR family transcriptional regulator [Phycisphaerae bacterium]|nr:MarR family transcriptional regulator [Phycisphaerae bacterium]
MQQLQNASDNPKARAAPGATVAPDVRIPAPSARLAARELLDVSPRMTFIIRELAYRHRTRSVSFPQLRVLALVHKVPCADLSFIARHLSLSLSAASRLVEHLVAKKLLSRTTPKNNRRKIALTLTPAGRKVLDKTTRAVEKELAARLAHLLPHSRQTLLTALHTLRDLCTATCGEEE